MKNILLAIIPILTICCDSKRNVAITNAADFEQYLTLSSSEEIQNLKLEAEFWESKLAKDPRGYLYAQKLGAARSALFDRTGDVAFLDQADRAFLIADDLVNGKLKSQNLLALSSISIKKHAFGNAFDYAFEASNLTNEKFGALMTQFDAEMELGNYERAKSILEQNERMDSFDYLVRLSKFKDHEGDLASAIVLMEKAQRLVQKEDSPRALWADANLGDMYGHAGRIEDSYTKYLEVLKREPGYDYALRGIAWIAYSADRNIEVSRGIINELSKRKALPDAYLLLAELAAYESNEIEAERYHDIFIEEAVKEKYAGMYNKYLIDLFATGGRFDEAISLAKNEVALRPTPAVYDWLAWAYYQKGERAKAIAIYQEFVDGQTYEPEVLYHMGTVYYQGGNAEKGEQQLKECLEAFYELGPVVTQEIKKMLS